MGINGTGGKFASGINNTGGKFAAGVNDTIHNFIFEDFFSFVTGVNDTSGAPWAANISVNFQKTFEMEYRGLGETDSWKKQKWKISWHCPFKIN